MPEVVKRKTIYTTDFCKLVAKTIDCGDSDSPYYALKVRDYVTILAVTEKEDILLVRQYRPAIEEMTLELPAGLVEDDEDPSRAAKRELIEETGYVANDVECLGWLYTDTGRIDNRMWCYFADDVRLQNNVPEVEEGIERVVCPLADLKRMIVDGKFRHALHLAVLFMALSKGKLPMLLIGKEL
jgi:ADP-ribose pyrophosphatase